MRVTQMPPVHAANLVANSGNTTYGVGVNYANPRYAVLPLSSLELILFWFLDSNDLRAFQYKYAVSPASAN